MRIVPCIRCKSNDWKRLTGFWPKRKAIVYRCRGCGIETKLYTEKKLLTGAKQ